MMDHPHSYAAITHPVRCLQKKATPRDADSIDVFEAVQLEQFSLHGILGVFRRLCFSRT